MIDPVAFSPAAVELGSSRVEELSSQTSTVPVGRSAGQEVDTFSSALAEIASGVVRDVREGEKVAISGINGQASIQQVVESVMAAEQSLQAAIAVRDKVVSAYQEISRMAI